MKLADKMYTGNLVQGKYQIMNFTGASVKDLKQAIKELQENIWKIKHKEERTRTRIEREIKKIFGEDLIE